MFSRRKKNYRVFVITALIICICVLIMVVLWPDSYNPISKDTEVNPNKDTTQIEEDKINTINETPINEDTDYTTKTYYIVKKQGETISVFFITEDGTQLKLEDTEIVYDLLTPEDQEKFDKGIVIEEQEDLALLLQDFEG